MKKLKLLFMDVDGTLTDGKLYLGNEGELFKAFNIKDGCGIHDILPQYRITPVIITARESKILERRCEELNIHYLFQGCKNKKEKMIQIAEQFDIDMNENGCLTETAYIGDDLPDIECMHMAQYKGCPADAVEKIRKGADFISRFEGGKGAVREFIEWLTQGE